MLVAVSLAAAPGVLALVRFCLKVYPDSPVYAGLVWAGKPRSEGFAAP